MQRAVRWSEMTTLRQCRLSAATTTVCVRGDDVDQCQQQPSPIGNGVRSCEIGSRRIFFFFGTKKIEYNEKNYKPRTWGHVTSPPNMCLRRCMYVCMYVYIMYVCVYMYVYIYNPWWNQCSQSVRSDAKKCKVQLGCFFALRGALHAQGIEKAQGTKPWKSVFRFSLSEIVLISKIPF